MLSYPNHLVQHWRNFNLNGNYYQVLGYLATLGSRDKVSQAVQGIDNIALCSLWFGVER